nr:MAG: internal scaffolding protein [Microvirus sp.]
MRTFSVPKRKRIYMAVSGLPTRVKQEFRTDVDINTIFAKAKAGVQPPAWLTSATPRFGDFTSSYDMQSAFDVVEKASVAFNALPLEFRREIDHDPSKIASAPRELWERFGLVSKPVPAGAGTPAPVGAGSPGSGTAVPGGPSKKAPKESVDDDSK